MSQDYSTMPWTNNFKLYYQIIRKDIMICECKHNRCGNICHTITAIFLKHFT